MVDLERNASQSITLANYCLCLLRQTKVKLPRRNQHFSLNSLAPSLDFFIIAISNGNPRKPYEVLASAVGPSFVHTGYIPVRWERGQQVCKLWQANNLGTRLEGEMWEEA